MSTDNRDILDEIELVDDGVEEIVYYIMGTRQIKVTLIDNYPEYVQAFDFRKKQFVLDRTVMKLINDSVDVRRVNKNDFANACLAVGVKPI